MKPLTLTEQHHIRLMQTSVPELVEMVEERDALIGVLRRFIEDVYNWRPVKDIKAKEVPFGTLDYVHMDTLLNEAEAVLPKGAPS